MGVLEGTSHSSTSGASNCHQLPKLGRPAGRSTRTHFPPHTPQLGLLSGTPHLQEVPTLTVDGDQVIVDGDELLRLADEEGSAVQLRPVGGEGELALDAQHVQAPWERAAGMGSQAAATAVLAAGTPFRTRSSRVCIAPRPTPNIRCEAPAFQGASLRLVPMRFLRTDL